MSYRRSLKDRCTIQRSFSSSADSYGSEVESWEVIESDLPCRLIERTERIASESLSLQKVRILSLLLPPEADVKADDRILAVQLSSGTTVGPFRVEDTMERYDRHRRRLIRVDLEQIDSEEAYS